MVILAIERCLQAKPPPLLVEALAVFYACCSHFQTPKWHSVALAKVTRPRSHSTVEENKVLEQAELAEVSSPSCALFLSNKTVIANDPSQA